MGFIPRAIGLLHSCFDFATGSNGRSMRQHFMQSTGFLDLPRQRFCLRHLRSLHIKKRYIQKKTWLQNTRLAWFFFGKIYIEIDRNVPFIPACCKKKTAFFPLRHAIWKPMGCPATSQGALHDTETGNAFLKKKDPVVERKYVVAH